MGHGTYSMAFSAEREREYKTKSVKHIFTQTNLHKDMNPNGVIRECRDSEDHPEALPIIIGLDVTGSMSHIPEDFIKGSMSKMMGHLSQLGLSDAQILFVGIGDHECDSTPLQVGQFEANDELMDKWLKHTYLEGGGGGNPGESYMLAWLFAARRTATDHFDKRYKKGFLFTIGDEPVLDYLPAEAQKAIFGTNAAYKDETSKDLFEEASKKYHVAHIHVRHGWHGNSDRVTGTWKQLIGDSLIIAEDHKDIPELIAKFIKNTDTSVEVPVIKNEQDAVEDEPVFI